MNADDRQTLDELVALCDQMPVEELLRFAEGTLRAATTAQAVLMRRFPLEWERFNLDVEEGRIV